MAPDCPEAHGRNQRLCHPKVTDNLSQTGNETASSLNIKETMIIFETINERI